MTAYLAWRKKPDRLDPEIWIAAQLHRTPPVVSLAVAAEDDLVALQVIPRDLDFVALNRMSREQLARLFPPPQPEQSHV